MTHIGGSLTCLAEVHLAQEDSFWPQHVGLDMELAKDTAEKIHSLKKKNKKKH